MTVAEMSKYKRSMYVYECESVCEQVCLCMCVCGMEGEREERVWDQIIDTQYNHF